MESTLAMGRIVHYKLSESDAEQINTERTAYQQTSPVTAIRGNHAPAGDVYPAIVVRVPAPGSANLQVILDGKDTYWATSVGQGTEPGTWAWPEISTPVTGEAAPEPVAQTPVIPEPVVPPTVV